MSNYAAITSTAPSLSSITLEIILEVILLLPLKDILSVRALSKFFYDAVECRIVWAALLRRLMRMHCITEASYPTGSLSLDTLKRLVIRADSFGALLKKENNGEIYAHSCRVLPCGLNAEDKQKFGAAHMGLVNDLLLASGGRFLVVLSTDHFAWPRTSLFSVFDLGYECDPITQSVVRYMVALDNLELKLFFPDPHVASTFWIVLTQRRHDRVTLYFLKLTVGSDATLTRFSQEDVPSDVPTFPFLVYLVPKSRNIAVVTYSGGKLLIKIINFVDQRYAVLVGLRDWQMFFGNLFPYSDCVLYAAHNFIAVWNIPPLEASLAGTLLSEYAPVSIVPIVFTSAHSVYIDYDTVTPIVPMSGSHPCILRVDGHSLTVIDVVGNDEAVGDHTLPKRAPFVKYALPITDLRMPAAVQDMHLTRCSDSLCVAGVNAIGTSISLFNDNFPADLNDEFKLGFVSTTLNHGVRTLSINAQEVCPVSRRVCISSPGGNVYIFSF